MDDIPSGFFKVPELEYYHTKPETPYPYPTSGMLHARKFREILKKTLKGEQIFVDQILQGHALSRTLSLLNRRELADFCRHVLQINRDLIGWQTVEKYQEELDSRVGPASWDLPNFIFTEDFNQLFTSILRWEMDFDQIQLLKTYFKTKGNPYLETTKFYQKLDSNNQFWNIKDLFLLLEGMVEQFLREQSEFQPFKPIIDTLTDLLMDEIRTKTKEIHWRIALLTIFSRGLSSIGFHIVEELQDILNRLWTELEQHYSKQDRDSYRYVFAVIYGYIGETYYRHNIGFVEKRIFINRILGSFFNFQEIEIEEWLENFLSSEVHELVMEYILHGFLNIVNLLNEYALELPNKTSIDVMRQRILTASHSLLDVAYNYLQRSIGTEPITSDDIHKIKKLSQKSGETSRIIKGMISIIITCQKYLSYYKSVNRDTAKIEISAELASLVLSEIEYVIYYKHLQMLEKMYPFESLLAKIHYETRESDSIVNSTTFEQEIISVASLIMEDIKSTYEKSNIVKTHILEQLFYYLSQWLHYFKKESHMFQDVLMITSPILSIILVQLIQAFYIQNSSALSLLIYLMMQHFVTTIRSEMILENSSDLEKTSTYLANDFRSIINEWNISDLPDIDSITDNIKTMRYSSDEETTGGMLDDDLVMGFFELISNLENSILASEETIRLDKIGELLYVEPSEGIHLFQRIGLGFEETMEFPLIRNFYKYHAAMSVIPFEVNISNYAMDLDIDSLISYFFSKERLL